MHFGISQQSKFSSIDPTSLSLQDQNSMQYHERVSIQNKRSQQSGQMSPTFSHQDRLGKRNFTVKLRTQQPENMERSNDSLIHEEYQLRIRSIVKQYELKLAKERQFYELRQWKHKEELSNLLEQNVILQSKKIRGKTDLEQSYCSQCSNGEIIKHMSKMFQQLQQSHQNCIQNKKEMMHQNKQLSSKAKYLQQEVERVEEQNKILNRKNRNLISQNSSLENQNLEMSNNFKSKESNWSEKQRQYQYKIKRSQKQTQAFYQEQVSKKRQQSVSPSRPLSNIQNKYKTSYNQIFARDQNKNNKQNANPHFSMVQDERRTLTGLNYKYL